MKNTNLLKIKDCFALETNYHHHKSGGIENLMKNYYSASEPIVESMKFQDLVWLFSCDNRNRGIIRLNFDEAALLWQTVCRTGGPILEIGRRHGGSTVLILAASSPRPVLSIDLAPEHHPACEQFFKQPSVATRLSLVVGNSRETTTCCFGCAFIDGDHTYAGVKADVVAHWASVLEHAAPPLFAFHDAVPNPGLNWAGKINHFPGVQVLCDQLVHGGYAIAEGSAGSMLVLRKLRELDDAFHQLTGPEE